MSRRKNRRPARRPITLALMILGAVLVIVAVAFAARPAAKEDGTPVLAVEPASIDFGYIKLDTPKTFALRVTNAGEGTLRFEEQPYLEVLEGC